MPSLELVAWWGAIVATTVFVWDIFKWVKSGPKIRATAEMPIIYSDSEVLSSKTQDDIVTTTYTEFCHIEIINTGTLPTTIFGFTTTHKNSKDSIKVSNSKYTPTLGNQLPYVLRPGEMWTHRIRVETIRRMAKMGKPFIEINLSHKAKPLVININDQSS